MNYHDLSLFVFSFREFCCLQLPGASSALTDVLDIQYRQTIDHIMHCTTPICLSVTDRQMGVVQCIMWSIVYRSAA